MHWKRIVLGAALGGGLLLAISYKVLMDNLIVDEVPKSADVIIVPEGMITEERARKAAALRDAGYDKSGLFIVSPMDRINQQYYEASGIKESDIINDEKAQSTYENARNTLKIMKEAGYHSALVVSSDYHMLRTRLIFERVNKRYGFELHYIAAYHEKGGHYVTWQEADSHIQKFARQEFPKYWLYLLGGYHLYADRSDS